MCELCLPRLTRRRAIGLAGAATAAALFGRSRTASAVPPFPIEFGIEILPRDAWADDARPSLEQPPTEDVRFLLVHHTAGPSDGDPVQLMRQVYDFHTGPDKGWPDVAYNFFIEPGGEVYEARAGSLQRAVEASATGGSQGFAQLVCLLGDFTDRNPTDAQLRSLNATLAWLATRYGLDTSPGATATFTSRGSNKWPQGVAVTADAVSGHREMSATACPGDTFYPYLKSQVQAEVHALRVNSSIASEPASPVTSVLEPETSAPSTTPPPTRPPATVPPATVPPTTVPATVADGPVGTPPAPQGEQLASDAPGSDQVARASASSNAPAWALGAGVGTVATAAALYVGVRGRHDDTDGNDATGDEISSTPG